VCDVLVFLAREQWRHFRRCDVPAPTNQQRTASFLLTVAYASSLDPAQLTQLNKEPRLPGKLIAGAFLQEGTTVAFDRRVDKMLKVTAGGRSEKVSIAFVRLVGSGGWVHTPHPVSGRAQLTF
jgi:hypothetical protein